MKRNDRVSNSRHVFLLIFVAFLLSILMACQPSKPIGQSAEIPFKDNSKVFTKWDEIFEQDTVIHFTFSNPTDEILSIYGIFIVPDKGYVIADRKAKRTLLFDTSFRYIQDIGGVGAGPGEMVYGVGDAYSAKDKSLYISDSLALHINKYNPPDYRFEKLVRIPFYYQKYILDDKNNFIVYSVSQPSVLQKIDQNGNVIKKAFQVNNLNFRAFSSRFQRGRLEEIPGEGFIFSYPEAYKVYYFDYDFNIKRIFYADRYSRFFPKPAVFPITLNPGDFTPAHAQWWGSELRMSRIFYVGGSFFLQELEEFVNMNSKAFVNLHDLSGKTYAKGVEPPFGDAGIILLTNNRYIYVVEDSVFDEKGNTTPVRLHRFKLKNTIGQD